MPKSTCSVSGCDRDAQSRGWCKTHYMRWYKHRTDPSGPIGPWGLNRTETCCVSGCDLPYDANGYCAPHYKRVVKYGEPGPAEIRPQTVGDDADYALVHLRLRKNQGPASLRRCVQCGGPARDWAYDHADPNEKVSDEGYAYSVNPSHYKPMCVSCHRRFDRDFNSPAQRDEMGRFAAIRGTE